MFYILYFEKEDTVQQRLLFYQTSAGQVVEVYAKNVK